MTKPSLDEVATVLETAAGLYEDEKIDWCRGTWVKYHGENIERISACAEGALLLATGHSAEEIFFNTDVLFADDALATEAQYALERAIRRETEISCSLHHWNDNFVGERHLGSDGLMTLPVRAKAKAEVIEMMKNTAKDLRNSQVAA